MLRASLVPDLSSDALGTAPTTFTCRVVSDTWSILPPVIHTLPETAGNLVLFSFFVADLLMRLLRPVIHVLVVLLDVLAFVSSRRGVFV